jgi:hypothetical protein
LWPSRTPANSFSLRFGTAEFFERFGDADHAVETKAGTNDRPIEGQDIAKDEQAQEQPADKKRALQNK